MRRVFQLRGLPAASVSAAILALAASAAAAPATPGKVEELRAAVESIRAAHPECRPFPPAVLERYGQGAEDPLIGFERSRRATHTTTMAPPTVTCGHIVWRLVRGAQAHPAAAGPPSTPLSGPGAHALTAVAGANLPLAGGLPTYQGEPYIAIDPNNPLRMVAGANTYQLAGPGCQSPTGGASTVSPLTLFASSNGGSNWTSTCAPWPATVTGGVPNAVVWFGGDPSLAWDRFGNAYASYLLVSQDAASTSPGKGSALAVAKSTDGGVTWGPPGVVANNITGFVPFNDKPMLAIDTSTSGAHAHPDRLYVVFTQSASDAFGIADFFEQVAHSDSGGTGSWTVVPMTPDAVSGFNDNGGSIAVAGDGTVYAVWNRFQCQGGGPGFDSDRMLVSSSTDGGATWSAPLVVRNLNFVDFCTNLGLPPQETRGINAFPSVAVDRNPASPFAGRVYIAVMDFPAAPSPASTRTDIYLYRSTDQGAHWSGPVVVNDDTSTTATQFFPSVAVDPSDGTVSVVWYDTRDSTTNRQTQVYYARSTDGGVTFEPNVRVTDGGAQFTNHTTSSDENLTDNPNANGNQYGDYLGLAVANRQASVVWADSRQFYPTAGDVKVEDIATATVAGCSPPVWSAPPALSCDGVSTHVTWTAPAFGANATSATYEVDRYTNPGCTVGKAVLGTGLTTTSFTDGSPVDSSTVYYYDVVATNDCPGTTLTPMSSVSACSAGAGGRTADALITAPPAVCPGSTGNVASMPDNGALAQYFWAISNGTITAGSNSRTITFTAGASGTVHLDGTVSLCTGAATDGVDIPVSATALAPPVITGPHSVCLGYAFILAATPGYASYQWSHGGTPIPGATSATFTKVATAADAGSYTVTGTNGCTTSASTAFALTVGPGSSAPPTVTPPLPITVVQTTCSGSVGGVTALTSPELATFLIGGSATDACDPSPNRLTPQVAGVDVTPTTLFGGGTTTVTFRFEDSAGHVGSATRTVTVWLYGDLNLDGVVDSTDLAILRSYLAGNVRPGTPPFTGPATLADLNGDGVVDAVDAVILAAKLTGSIACLPRR